MARRREARPRAAHGGGSPQQTANALLARRIDEFCLDALASVSPAKVEETARQWLSKKNLDPNAPSSALLVMEAFALAGYLALFTPSLLGAAPIERFIRQRRANADHGGRAALDALAQASFYLIQLKSRVAPQILSVKNMASGENLSIFDKDIPNAALGAYVATWLAPLPDGGFVALGPLTPLDAGALAEGLGFVRPGAGMSNPRRCAAAVYRHVMRHDGLRIEGLNLFPEDLLEEFASIEEEDEYDDLDRLAFAFAATKKDDEPEAALMREARKLAGATHMFEVLTRNAISREHGRADLAEAFSRIGFIMMENSRSPRRRGLRRRGSVV